jgi:hypothetical protein
MLKYISLAAVTAMFFLISCEKDAVDKRTEVCFESDVLPILQSNCTQSGCHNAQDRADGYATTNYPEIMTRVKPGDYKGSKLYQSLIGRGELMPKKPYDPLSDNEIAIIALWIDSGAKNTTNCVTGVCDTTVVTLAGQVKPIFDKYCNGCHSANESQGGIDLETYNRIKRTVDNGSLIGSITHNSNYSKMPKNGNKIPDCDIAKISKWIRLGALNN